MIRKTRHSILVTVIGIAALGILAALSGLLFVRTAARHAEETRGLGLGAPAPLAGVSPYGVNVVLDQDVENLERSLDFVQGAGFRWIRQRFPWAQIEAQQGVFHWETYDRIVDAAAARRLRVIAVLDTSPTWARATAVETSPPRHPEDYGRFVAAFVTHYRGRVGHIQIWDEPNIYPHWGELWASPEEYVALLKAAYAAAKAADSSVTVLAGGLAPTLADDRWNLNDVMFLRRMYGEGARSHFDVLAAKPYGFWTGPDDRRVDMNVLNFSRVILLRETMVRNGDAARPIWAVEMGWNALPGGWSGRPSPWGSDDEGKQAQRLAAALTRARAEWPWLHVLTIQGLRFPQARPDDPIHGFALVDATWTPRLAYREVQRLISEPPVPPRVVPSWPVYVRLGVLAVVAVLCVLGVVVLMPQLPWAMWDTLVLRLPTVAQAGAMAAALVLYYTSPALAIAATGAATFAALALVRLDIGLCLTALTFPFYLYARPIGNQAFSLPETLTLLCFSAWLARLMGQRERVRPGGMIAPSLFFLAVALLSLAASQDLRLSLRELRTVVIEPVMFYSMAVSVFDRPGRWPRHALAWTLVLAGAAAAGQALIQYFVTDQGIGAEGVVRAVGPYGSPNNLGLLLERILPLSLALLLQPVFTTRAASAAHDAAKRPCARHPVAWILYPASVLIGAALLLTYSIGAWLGATVGLVVLAALRGRRRVLLLLAGLLALAIVLLPFLRSQRVVSHLELSGDTTAALRLDLWRSSVEMVRDHGLRGVGLDGFLEMYRGVYIRPTALREPNLSHPHNLLLEWWLFLGILGVPVLLWFLLSFGRHAWPLARTKPVAQGAMAAMAAAVVHGMVDRFYFGAPDLAFIFFVLLALGEQRHGDHEVHSP